MNTSVHSNLSTLTFLGHDPEAWVCTRCGLIELGPFTRMHRPITNPGVRTCGGVVVPARLYHEVLDLIKAHWLRWAKHISELESGKTPLQHDSGAYGIWQTL